MLSKLSILLSLLLVYIVTSKVKVKNDYESLGVVYLDAITFPKIVPHETKAVLVMVFSKTSVGDNTADQLRNEYYSFAQKGELQGNADDVLFAQVMVNGAQNAKLADRIGMTFNNNQRVPKLFLFKPKNPVSISFPETSSFTFLSLSRFVSRHTDFFFGNPGTIEEFDLLAERFVYADPIEYKDIIEHALKISPKVEPKDKKNAEYYINTMKKIAEVGKDWIKTEIMRLESLLQSQISADKKREIQKRVNIVHQFDRETEEPEL
jgi:hypothetical protein